MSKLLVIVALLGLAACSRPAPVASVSSVADPGPTAEKPIEFPRADEGRRIIESYGCTSCHEIVDRAGEELTRPEGGRDCFGCHRAVIAGEFAERPEKHAEWQRTLPKMFDVPSLRGAGRLERSWLVAYLQNPHDVRHNLDSMMPRLPISGEEAEAIADFLGSAAGEPPAPHTDEVRNADRGKQLFDQNGCSACHGNAPADVTGRALILAPNLGWAKERFGFDGLVAWIQHPREQKPDTMMPDFGFTAEEAADVAAYVMTIETPKAPEFSEPELRKVYRRVEFAEVHRLLRDRCLHCHNEPKASSMGGPGYTGGWGFEGKSLSLLTYRDFVAGGRDADGKRSMFDPVGDEGRPRIVEHLIARHREMAGQSSEVLGMPLGQPPVPWEQIEVVNAWIEQGRRPPARGSYGSTPWSPPPP